MFRRSLIFLLAGPPLGWLGLCLAAAISYGPPRQMGAVLPGLIVFSPFIFAVGVLPVSIAFWLDNALIERGYPYARRTGNSPSCNIAAFGFRTADSRLFDPKRKWWAGCVLTRGAYRELRNLLCCACWPVLEADMRRRDFVAIACGALAWPLMVRAQQTDRARRVGVLPTGYRQDRSIKACRARCSVRRHARQARLERWVNMKRRGPMAWKRDRPDQGGNNRARRGTAPDVFVVSSNAALTTLKKELNKAIPAIFVQVSDPCRGRICS